MPTFFSAPPPTEVGLRAAALSRARSHPAVHAHSERSWQLAAALGERLDLAFDAELLHVAAMLHDLGLAPSYDVVTDPFEVGGGSVAVAFATGAGWDDPRCRRLAEVIERHMWTTVDPMRDPESFLLEAATGLDVSGAEIAGWDRPVLLALIEQLPRDGFAETFAAAIAEQAERKPHSAAARLHASGAIAQGEALWQALANGRPLHGA